ncbi:hypothetical protein LTR85_010597 [Meristemomyces frigidus]|nr:hypothetical protein LTR85_010597 [Meristemomyces frigidus]
MVGTDSGRKDLHEKVGDKMTPDSSKSTTDKISDSVTGTADKVGRDVMPDSSKSNTQSAQDKISRTADSHKPDSDKSLLDKAKDATGLGK